MFFKIGWLCLDWGVTNKNFLRHVGPKKVIYIHFGKIQLSQQCKQLPRFYLEKLGDLHRYLLK